MKTKVLLLGGTGAMGVYLAPILADAGCDVVVTTRRARNGHDPERPIRYCEGNARDAAFCDAVLAAERPDAVVDFMSYGAEEFGGRLDNLLRSTGHYVFLSSYRVFGDGNPVTERTPRLLDCCPDPVYVASHEYAIDKAREEDMIWRSSFKNWTIVRPSITYSSRRFQFGCLEAHSVCYRALRGLPVPIYSEMFGRKTSLTWGRDVAMLIARLIGNAKAFEDDFNVVTDEWHTWREVAEIYHEEIGLEVAEVSLSEYEQITRSPYQIRYDRMFNRVLDNTKVLAATGTRREELTPLRVGLRRELAAFKKSPIYPWSDFSRLGRIDRVLGTRIPLAELSWAERVEYLRALHPGLERYAMPLRQVKRLCRFLCGGRR